MTLGCPRHDMVWGLKGQGHRVSKSILHTRTAIHRHLLDDITSRLRLHGCLVRVSLTFTRWRGIRAYECLLVLTKALLFCRYLQEYSALGTAGGMYHFRDQILTGNPNLFFVMNADVCGDFPLQEMLEFHQSVDTAPHFTILATEVCDESCCT